MASGRSFTSKLLSFMGSQSSLPEKNSQDDIGSSQITASEANSTPRQKHHSSRDDAQDKHRTALSPAAAIASSKDGSLPEMDSDGGEGEDFGTLQMFDSNASSMPYSSQAAPEAVMTSPKKKRDRKRSKNKNSNAPASSTLNGSTADYDMPDAGEDANEATIASSPRKKKRRYSDSADSNGRKKRKSHKSSGEDGFLRRNKDRAATPEATGEVATSQVSPSVAHGRRRSQSRDGEEPGAGEISDVEALAREAWNEHLNTQRNAASQAESNAADPADSQPAAEEQPEETPGPRRGRSTRQKKAKPTYFEQPLVDDDDKENERRNAAGELPSPSAMPQVKRGRKQPAAPKKTPKRQRQRKQKLANSMQGLDGEVAYRGSQKDFKQGKFSTEELDRIDDAIERFRLEHGYDKTHVNAMIQAPGGTGAGEDHAQLWLTILAECPDRHRQKVINVCRKKHHNFVARGTWTPEQDYELAEQINIHGTKWAVIGPIINRHPEDIRDRYRNYLVCGDTQRKEAWTEEEEALLTESVIDAMKSIDDARRTETANEVLQTKSYDELIDWQLISAQMGRTRSRLQCITKWKSMNLRNVSSKDKLASSQPDAQISFRLEMARRQIDDMPDEEKYRFVLAVQNSAVGVDNKIPWNKLMDKKFRQEYHKNTQVVLWSRLKQSVPGAETKTTRDCAQYLVEHYNQEGSLPDVTGEGFDDAEEMALVREVVKSEPASERGSKGAISNERVDGDEAQDDDQLEQEMQIDPALTEVPKSSKKSTPAAKRTLNGKKPSGRKPTRPTEPVEEDELPELPTEDAEEDAEEDADDDGKKKKKRKSSKKSSKKKVKAPSSDSVMDDMDDIPAR